MQVAIIGLPRSGKTTVFNALTRGHADTTGAADMHVGVVKVADPRLEVLAKIYRPKKVVHAEIKYWDLPGPESLAKSQGIGGKYLNVLQAADAFLLVVGNFTDPSVPHPLGGLDPGRDLTNMRSELSLADLLVLDRAVERLDEGIKKSKPAERPALVTQLGTVRKVKQGLEEGLPLRRQTLTGSESSIIANYQLLTSKPVIVVFNIDEAGPEVSMDQLGLGQESTAGVASVSLSGKLEADLALMSDDEAEAFRSEMDLGESAVSQVVRASYETLGLVSFLTVGEDEVRAWSVPAGLPAQQAAATIHTDFERGFIRALVIPYEDLVRCGSIAQGRKEGVLRSEGKTYGVSDGDVIDFLTNV
jgi:GTP-binding protein YchF